MAIDSPTPPSGAVIHSDRGVQFGFWAFTDRVKASGLQPSMGTMADCTGNAMIESFWSRTQFELLNRKRWNSNIELANAMSEDLEIWHSALGRLSPVAFETQNKIVAV